LRQRFGSGQLDAAQLEPRSPARGLLFDVAELGRGLLHTRRMLPAEEMNHFRSQGAWEREETSVRGRWRRRSVAGWGLGCVLFAIACGEAIEPSSLVGAAGSLAGGVGGAPGGAGTGQGGRVWPPATAPACTMESDAPFIGLVVSGPRSEEPQRLRVLERGIGLPAGMALPLGATSANQLGWLRLREVAASLRVDAGANDAGPRDAGSNDAPERILLGPGELAELPLAVGDELTLAEEHYSTGPTALGEEHQRIVLQRDDRVLLYHQFGLGLGTYSGMTLSRGGAICATRYPSPVNSDDDYRCAYIYHHELELTVPGGATATLMSGQAQTIGDYRATHGSTTVQDFSPRLPGEQACADLYYSDRATEITVVLRPSP
jgi:hypothetical protein